MNLIVWLEVSLFRKLFFQVEETQDLEQKLPTKLSFNLQLISIYALNYVQGNMQYNPKMLQKSVIYVYNCRQIYFELSHHWHLN